LQKSSGYNLNRWRPVKV